MRRAPMRSAVLGMPCSAATASGSNFGRFGQNAARPNTNRIDGSSVSGLYFFHPQARYFGLGKIGRDQVEDYARRKGMSVEEIERWLAMNLAY